MADKRSLSLEGPALVAWAALASAVIVLIAVLLPGSVEQEIRRVVRASAKFSVVCFALAFAASSLRHFWRVPASAWLLRNRRYMGLSFALFHFLHLAALIAWGLSTPEFRENLDALTLVGGGTAYVFVAAQALTSNDASVRLLGRQRWTLLHTLGSYTVWAVFTFTYLPIAIAKPWAAAASALLFATLGLRIARRVQRKRRPG